MLLYFKPLLLLELFYEFVDWLPVHVGWILRNLPTDFQRRRLRLVPSMILSGILPVQLWHVSLVESIEEPFLLVNVALRMVIH